jgi:hypothetical protein
MTTPAFVVCPAANFGCPRFRAALFAALTWERRLNAVLAPVQHRSQTSSYAISDFLVIIPMTMMPMIIMRMFMMLMMFVMLMVVPFVSSLSVSVVIVSMSMIHAKPGAMVIVETFVVSGVPVVAGIVVIVIHHVGRCLNDNRSWLNDNGTRMNHNRTVYFRRSDRNANMHLGRCVRRRQRHSQNQTKDCEYGFL